MYEDEIDFCDLEMNLSVWYVYKNQNPKQLGGTKLRQIVDQFINCN